MSNKVPQLRFNGYSDAWEERKLGEVYKFQYGQFNNNPDNGGQYPIYGANGIIGGYNEYNAENSIIIGHMGAYAGHVLWGDGRHFVTYNGTIGLENKKILDARFGYYLTLSVNIPRLTAGSGQPFVSYSDLNGIKIVIPNLDEQQKIGVFFKQLDNTIALHQHKLDLLKEQKKGYLQKMFPKNGAKVPELRFAGFADDWEERKLIDIADRFDNLRVPITESDRKSGDTPYYGANGIQDYVEGFTHDGEFILVAEDGANDLKNYPVQYVNGKVWVNNHAHVLQGKKTITDNKFLMNSIKNFNIEPFLVGGGRAKLNADVMMKLNILLPTFDEQEKIGSFFKQLDETIDLHQRKLDLLKEQKKGLLQKMFV